MAGKVPTTVTINGVGTVKLNARVPSVIREHTNNRQINGLQQAIADATAAARSGPRNDGMTTIAASFTSGSTSTISHRLGRAYVGWSVNSAKGHAATVYETTSSDSTKYLVLVNDSTNAFTCNVEVW